MAQFQRVTPRTNIPVASWSKLMYIKIMKLYIHQKRLLTSFSWLTPSLGDRWDSSLRGRRLWRQPLLGPTWCNSPGEDCPPGHRYMCLKSRCRIWGICAMHFGSEEARTETKQLGHSPVRSLAQLTQALAPPCSLHSCTLLFLCVPFRFFIRSLTHSRACEKVKD